MADFGRYEEDIGRLRHELEARGGPPSHMGVSGLPGHGSAHPGPAPPSIGHGPSNLFGGIMSNQGGQGQPGLTPLSQEQQAQQSQQQQQQPPPPPQQQQQQPPPPPQQQQGGPPPHQLPQGPQSLQQQGPYQTGYPHQPVVNGKPSNVTVASTPSRLTSTGYGAQNQIASPGAGKPRSNIGPRGHASTPQQNQPMPYPGQTSPTMGRPTPPPQVPNVGNMLADLNPDDLRSDQKREGPDWYAVFNPNVRRALDIELMWNLPHESVVCCVRFSHDGTRVATGCNRSAQIFDVATGNKLTTLTDESVDKEGDLYIRSVCFSPDGNYLATGAEDKQIRVKTPGRAITYHVDTLI